MKTRTTTTQHDEETVARAAKGVNRRARGIRAATIRNASSIQGRYRTPARRGEAQAGVGQEGEEALSATVPVQVVPLPYVTPAAAICA